MKEVVSVFAGRRRFRSTSLSGFVAGNFSAYWLGLAILGLMAIAFGVSTSFPGGVMVAPSVFAFGLVAFGFLGMGPITIAVDSYGPVTDNAQSSLRALDDRRNSWNLRRDQEGLRIHA